MLILIVSFERIVSDAEYAQRKKMRRSVVALKDLPKGHTLQRDDLEAKRPGDGISVAEIDTLVGKVLKKNVLADTLIRKEDLL